MYVDEMDGQQGLPVGFVDLPWAVYADDPDWIPEDREGILTAFSDSNPWFAHGRARAFCIPERARAVGFFRSDVRIAGERVAFFGYWETVGDAMADRMLFERIFAWASSFGARALYGPINFSTFGNYRLRLNAEPGARTYQGEPYNPGTYPTILELQGFVPDQYYVCQIADLETVRYIARMRPGILQSLQDAGYRYEPLSRELWLDNLETLHALVDATFAQNFAYTPVSFESFRTEVGASLIEKACPHTSVMVFSPDDTLVAFSLTYPHYGPLACQGAGTRRISVSRLSFAAHAHLLDDHPPVGLLCKTVGVAPGHRSKGILNSLMIYAMDRAGDRYQRWYGAVMRADNPSRKYTRGAHQLERWYALYRCRLSG